METAIKSPAQLQADAALQRQQDMERMFLQTDQYVAGLPPEQKAALDSWVSWSPDPKKDIRRSVSEGYVADHYQLPNEALENGGYQAYRDRYAQDVLGVTPGSDFDDETFFGLVKAQKQKERDFRIQANSFKEAGAKSASSLDPSGITGDLAKVSETAGMIEGMEGQKDALIQSYISGRQEFESKIGPYRGVARQISSLLDQSTGKKEGDGKEVDALDLLLTVPEESRLAVFQAIEGSSAPDPEKGGAQKAGERAGRGFMNMIEGAGASWQRGSIISVRDGYKAGKPVTIFQGETLEQAVKREALETPESLKENAQDIVRQTTKSTPEQAAEAAAIADKLLEKNILAGKLRDFAQQKVDPAEGTGPYSRAALGAAESVGAMLPIGVPGVGVMIAQGAYADEAFQNLKDAGMPTETAHQLSQVTGAIEAGLDKLQLEILVKTPIAKPLKGGLLKGLIAKVAAVQGPEYVIEKAQDAAPIATAYLAERLGIPLPEQARWQKDWEAFKFLDKETFLTLLPLSLIGGGYQGLKESREARALQTELVADPVGLRAVGIPAAEADRIAALDQGERLKVYAEAYQNRDPNSPEAAAAQQELAQRAAAENLPQQAEDLQQAAGVSAVVRTNDGWEVQMEDGTAVPTDSIGAATQMMEHIRDSNSQADAESMVEMTDFLFRNEKSPFAESVKFTPEIETAADRISRSSDPDAVFQRMQVEAARSGQEFTVGNTFILGENSLTFKERIADDTRRIVQASESKVNRLGNVLTAIEEPVEGRWEAGLASGIYSQEQGVKWARLAEQITGEKLLDSENDNEVSPLGVTEAISKMVVLDVLGRRKDGTRAPAGTISKGLVAATQAGAGKGLRAFLNAWKARFQQVFRAAAKLAKARDSGGFGAEKQGYDDFIDSLLGGTGQAAHNRAVAESANSQETTSSRDIGSSESFSISSGDYLENLASTIEAGRTPPAERLRRMSGAAEELRGMARAIRFNDEAFPTTDRKEQLRSLAALDAMLMKFPAEVRGKVGGFTKLASLTTNEARSKFFSKRVAKLGEVFERHLKKEFTDEMKALLKRAEVLKGEPGEKMKGKGGADAHYLMDAVRAAMAMGPAEVEGRIADLTTRIDSAELTTEQEALATMERELVQLTGDWSNADASRMEAALKAVENVWADGFQAWQAKLAERRERRAATGSALLADTGKSGTKPERDARAERDNGWKGSIKDFALAVSSFEEVVSYTFGKESAAGKALVDSERRAAYAKEDENQATAERVEDFFKKLAGGKALAGEQLRYKLSQKSIDAGRGGKLSEMEAAQALLMWAQEDGKRHMQGPRNEDGQPVSGGWHYDQDWIDSIRSKMSPEGMAVLDFISGEYAREHGEINPLYRERHGVNLPKNDAYAPITVTPQQAKAGEFIDPVTGQAGTGSALTPGSLRTRSRVAVAEPKFQDALQTMIAHKQQMSHWKHYYDFAVEAQAVLGNRGLGNAVEAAAGAEGKSVLRKWVDYFGQGGNRDAGATLAANRLLSETLGRGARMALVGRASTLMIQSTQLGAALAEMPTGAYISRLGKLLAGRLSWRESFDSPFIQRRLNEAPPVVQQAMQGLKSKNPNIVKHTVARLGRLISGADALFTSGTYSIILDYQRGLAKQAGLTGAEAEEWARNEAERSTERVAQPTRPGARSMFENTASQPLVKLSFAFASEARQKAAMLAWAAANARKDPAHAARVAAVVWIVGGLMASIIRGAWRDARDDEDDEIFDERNWGAPRLVAGTLAGPLNGIPGFGDSMEGIVNNAFGVYTPDGNLLDSPKTAVSAVGNLVSGKSLQSDEPVDAVMRDAENILMGMGLANETMAASASLAHIVRDGAKLVDNFFGD